MHTKTGRWMVLTLLVFLIFPACSTPPQIKFQKPELLGEISSDQIIGSTSSLLVISATQAAMKLYDTEFVPPLAKLAEITGNFSAFTPIHKMCADPREPLRESLKATQRLYVELLKAEKVIRLSSSNTDKEKEIAGAGGNLIMEMQIGTAMVLQTLADADAYGRSCEERNLSQLRPENEASLKKSSKLAEKAVIRINEAKTKFLKTLG